MTQEERNIIYNRAIKVFGQEAQLKMAIEEMSELTKAICKLFRNNGERERLDACEEIADVEIMMEQLKVLFGSVSIEICKQRKINRLETLLKDKE